MVDASSLFETEINGATDGTGIGNVGDRMKVIDQDVIAAIVGNGGGGNNSMSNIVRFSELAITLKTETDFGSTYTVAAGKKFCVTSFSASYDAQAALYVRFKKQTGGVGSFVTIFRLNMMSGGQGNSTLTYALGDGIIVGAPGDVFKITIEASIRKGTVAAHFAGIEY